MSRPPWSFILARSPLTLSSLSQASGLSIDAMEHGRHEGGGSYDHGSPMEFLKAHPPGPPSYIAHDLWPVPEDELTGWPLLMLLHIFTFSVAFFVLLPACA